MANPRWVDQPAQTKSPDHSLSDAYRAVFDSPMGQRVLDDLFRHANSPSMNTAALDPNLAIWIQARQNLMTYVHRQIEAAKTRNGG